MHKGSCCVWRGKQVAQRSQLPAPSSAELSQRPFSPPAPARKQELCAAPERPDAVLAIGKVGETEPRRKRGRGSGCAVGFSGQVGSASRGPAGTAVPWPAAPAAKSPPAPRPARPPPAPSAPCCPAQRPAGRPGLPPRSRLPGRGKLPGAEVRTKRPSPEPLGTHAAAAAAAAARRSLLATEPPAARAATRPQGAWEKPAPPRRGAPPHRSGQRQAALTRARAGQQLRRPDSGAVAITATTLDSPRGDPALMPRCRPESPGAQAHSSRLASVRNPRKDRPPFPPFFPLPPIFTSL